MKHRINDYNKHMNKLELRKNKIKPILSKEQNNERIVPTDLNVVLKILSEVISGKNLNEVFNQNINNANLNIGKIKDITYGVMRYYFILNSILNDLAKNEPQLEIKILLLIALYEIKYTKKPAYAITNDIVDLSFKLTKNIKIKNFTNAIIRNFLRTQIELEKKLVSNLEYKYNFPQWIISKLRKDYPDNWENIIEYSNRKPKISLRINPNKTNIDDYIKYLDKENISYKLVDNIVVLDSTIAIEKIPFFKEGYVSIQDTNAQKLKDIIKFNPNQYILDACSAPGGKACQILENNKVNLLAIDIDKNRLDKVQQSLTRLNLNANTICADASKLDWWDNKQFDIIIADVPCSASGTLKRNPDIKLHRQLSDIKNFVITQRNIILNLWNTLKNDGHMVYITCSIFKEENQENISFFRQKL
ncbi:MAG TPA: 16S rRNA (cytosine(967)-C(5))-methyltransferase RsmB, partial [Aquella sp.]|nr:16S rRNA (cytosine(967)-C(5))-methyltransferase RsmB [Aquella sp.]